MITPLIEKAKLIITICCIAIPILAGLLGYEIYDYIKNIDYYKEKEKD